MGDSESSENTKLTGDNDNKCSSDEQYTMNIITDSNDNYSYTIVPNQENIDSPVVSTSERGLAYTKLNELGWYNPLDETSSDRYSKQFIEDQDLTKDEFTNSDIHKIHNCYITRRCEGTDNNPTKIIDYHCNQQIPYESNSIVTSINRPVDPPLYMKHTLNNPIFNDDRGYVRCEQGYIFNKLRYDKNSQEEYATAKWIKDGSKLWWVKPDTNQIGTPTIHELDSNCVPDKCRETVVADSISHSYDPLTGGHTDEPIVVNCNDGYMFNHDLLHQGGKVKCDYDLNIEDPSKPNNMNWYIHDDRLDDMCRQHTTIEECRGLPPTIPAPTYSPYSFINIPSEEDKYLYQIEKDIINGYDIAIGCQWQEGKSINLHDNTISIPSQCRFRKKIDSSEYEEPICLPIYCPEKDIPNSDRDGYGTNHPLPGPLHEKKGKGECYTMDGTKVDIDNVQDCLCYQHQSCRTCAADDNCQWCGGDISKSPNSTPGCYAAKTTYPICRIDSIKQSGGGSCKTIKTTNGKRELKPNWDRDWTKQTKENCENEHRCINGETNQDVAPSPPGSDEDRFRYVSMQGIIRNYYEKTPPGIDISDRSTEFICNAWNNKWVTSEDSIGDIEEDVCIFSKNKVKDSALYSQESIDLPLHKSNDKTYHISTSPYYCKPTESDTRDTCYNNVNYRDCIVNGCLWTENNLSDSIINWSAPDLSEDSNSYTPYSDIIRIMSNINNENCYLCSDNSNNKTLTGNNRGTCTPLPISNPSKDAYFLAKRSKDSYNSIDKAYSKEYIDILNLEKESIAIDGSVEGKCKIQYIDKETFGINNPYNIMNEVSSRILNNEQYTNKNAINCIRPPDTENFYNDGFKYCDVHDSYSDCGGNPTVPFSLYKGEQGLDNMGNKEYCPMGSERCSTENQKCLRINTGDDEPRNINLITSQISEPTSIYQEKREFYSLSGKTLSGIKEQKEDECSRININNIDSIKYNGTEKYSDLKFTTCSISRSNSNHKKKVCELINKKNNVTEEDTSHWGKFCVKENQKIPMKHICERNDRDINTNQKIRVWTQGRGDDGWNGICYNISTPTNPSPIDESTLCNIEEGYTPESEYNCIISVPSDTENTIIANICESWETPGYTSDNKYIYYDTQGPLREHGIEMTPKCSPGLGRSPLETVTIGSRRTEEECTYDNNEYSQTYQYSNKSFCPDPLYYKPDRPLRWTGGELKQGDGDWESDCSASILSSCPVKCDGQYGGGGNYTCHYNNHAEDVCSHVENTFKDIDDYDTQKKRCEHFPNCSYKRNDDIKNSECISRATPGSNLIKGQAEWLGNTCYLLDNDTFSHGIYNLSTLNEYFRPLKRLFLFFFILILFAMLFRYMGIYARLVGLIRNIFGGVSKSVVAGTGKLLYDYTFGLMRLIVTKKWKLLFLIIFILVVISVICLYITYWKNQNVRDYISYSKEDIIKIKQNIEYDKDSVKDNISGDKINNLRKYLNLSIIIGIIVLILVIRPLITFYKEGGVRVRYQNSKE